MVELMFSIALWSAPVGLLTFFGADSGCKGVFAGVAWVLLTVFVSLVLL